jgi:serine/threonine protein kinase
MLTVRKGLPGQPEDDMASACARCGLFHPETAPCAGQMPLGQDLAPGSLLTGRYRISRALHRGGMSVVYLAEDTLLGNRQVAVKELRLPVSTTPEERRESEAWFAREAYILSSLNHDLIPEFYSAFAEGGTSYIVQEYAAGENLNEIVRLRGPLPESEVLDWALALCGLLAYLHSLDEPVLFRDFKPANIVLCDAVAVAPDPVCPLKVVDFGIARHYSPRTVGTIIGTPGYSPPEQYQGLATPQSDIYALGATLYRLLTGYDPEQGTPFSFPDLRSLAPNVSPELAAVVSRSLRLDPSQRYQSATEMGDALFQLARVRSLGQDAWVTAGPSLPLGPRPGTRSQRAFRWTALFVCVMMVAPGVLGLLEGTGNSPSVQVSNSASGCLLISPGSVSESVPAQVDCRGWREMSIRVVAVPGSQTVFVPSDVTASPGAMVFFDLSQAGACEAELQLVSSAGPESWSSLVLSQPGVYRLDCANVPSTPGVIQVR